MKVTTIQCASRIDHISDDGTPAYQQPYPYSIRPDGSVAFQSLWKGEIAHLIGFQDKYDVQRMSVLWHQVCENPDLCLGKYPVFADSKGNWANMDTPVEQVTLYEVSDEKAEAMLA